MYLNSSDLARIGGSFLTLLALFAGWCRSSEKLHTVAMVLKRAHCGINDKQCRLVGTGNAKSPEKQLPSQ
jgi:hypothetical protein